MTCDVFISHHGVDAYHCDRLRRLLEKELRLSVYVERMDAEIIGPRSVELARVGDRLRGHGATFVVLTRHARGATWLARAIEQAHARRQRLVPVVFDDAAARQVAAEPGLARHHFLDGRRSDEDLVFALWRCLYASLTVAA